jgi:hypothetical protein
MSGIFGLIHRIFNATPPAGRVQATAEPLPAAAPAPVAADALPEGNTKVKAYLDRLAADALPEGNTKVKAYLDRLAAEPQAVTGVAKYLVKLDRDEFSRLNQLPTPTGVARYIGAQHEVTRVHFPKGPSGVQKYLAGLEAA